MKKLHLNRKGNSFFAKNLLNYLKVWLSSDKTGHDSEPKISKYSAEVNMVEELKPQKNVSKIAISSIIYHLITMRMMTNKKTSWKTHD